MPNMSLHKVKMPEQKPDIRNKNFQEVSLGYRESDAKEEAERCLNCKTRPCMNGCPVNVQIPAFIQLVKEGDYAGAYRKITETNALPAICGRVCPQENQCEKFCVRGKKGESVAIGRLERFVADWFLQHGKEEEKDIRQNGKRVAVVGSGPSGLTCAGDLAGMGYEVTVFEAFHTAGGVLVYGIPEFRLPKDIVQKEVENLKHLGVRFEMDSVAGKLFSVDELLQNGFEAVYIGSGAGLPRFMNIEGEQLNGVYSSNEFLTRINLMKAYQFPNTDTPVHVGKRVAVIGGGNVAMDAARCAKRMGADEVTIVYRRTEAEMPARNEEIGHAREEGIRFEYLTNPTRMIGDEQGYVHAIECVRMELGEPDESGRRRPVTIPDSTFQMEADTVIVAIGQSPNPLIKDSTPDLKTQPWGGILADEETGKTSKPGVFAGGDAVTGAATVILAMGAGKIAAKSIDEYIQNK